MITLPAIAQVPLLNTDARSKGMGNSCAVLSGNYAGYGNPAGLALVVKPGAGVFCENLYLTNELFIGAMALVYPSRAGNFSVSYAVWGTSALKQGQSIFSFGRKLGKYARAGMGVHYLSIRQAEGCQDLFAVLPSLGFQLIPAKNLVVGFHVFNPARQSYHPDKSVTIPSFISSGIGYLAGDNLLVQFEVMVQSDRKPLYSGGLEADIGRKIKLRFGTYTGDHLSYTAGAGFIAGRLTIDIALIRHYVIGFSPGLALSYSFK